MRTLLKPYPDELLYSVVARTAVRYGYWSPKKLMKAVYGRRTVLAVPDLPSNLAELASHARTSWRLSVDEIASRHTLVGYYTHFLGVDHRADAIARMAAKGGHLQVRLGICAGSAIAPKRFQYCPRCREADLTALGESFWRRSHHLPGVLVCHVHGVRLLETALPFRPIGQHEHSASPLGESAIGLSPLLDRFERPEVVQAIATRSARLLDAPPRADDSALDYRPTLAACGFAAGRSSFARLEGAFQDYFGPAALQASFRRYERSNHLGWLAEALRSPRRRLHPFKHVLLSLFIEAHAPSAQAASPPASAEERQKTWRIYQSPELRGEANGLARLGLTTCAVARALEVDWKTASKLLKPLPSKPPHVTRDLGPDRAAWREMAAMHPSAGKKQLRHSAPALYARLYRNDREWLLAWTSEAGVAPRVMPTPRLDWAARDTQIADRIRMQVMETLSYSPACRASQNHVLGTLGIRALLRLRGRLLPKSVAALNALCESVEAFQVRRLVSVLANADRVGLSDSQLLWRGRINRARHQDGGAALLALARKEFGEAHLGE